MVVLAENDILTFNDISQYDIFSNSTHTAHNKSLKDVRQAAERNHIIRMLEINDFNMDDAALDLQITSRQLYNKINEYDIKLRKK
jgi:DNA-binding NtrC family response regulator